MTIFDEITDALEDAGFKVEIDVDKRYFLAETWTGAAGEDVPIEFEFDPGVEGRDIVEYLYDLSYYFDIDSYAEPFIASRGQHGIPESISLIMDSAGEVGEIYQRAYEIVNSVVNQ